MPKKNKNSDRGSLKVTICSVLILLLAFVFWIDTNLGLWLVVGIISSGIFGFVAAIPISIFWSIWKKVSGSSVRKEYIENPTIENLFKVTTKYSYTYDVGMAFEVTPEACNFDICKQILSNKDWQKMIAHMPNFVEVVGDVRFVSLPFTKDKVSLHIKNSEGWELVFIAIMGDPEMVKFFPELKDNNEFIRKMFVSFKRWENVYLFFKECGARATENKELVLAYIERMIEITGIGYKEYFHEIEYEDVIDLYWEGYLYGPLYDKESEEALVPTHIMWNKKWRSLY